MFDSMQVLFIALPFAFGVWLAMSVAAHSLTTLRILFVSAVGAPCLGAGAQGYWTLLVLFGDWFPADRSPATLAVIGLALSAITIMSVSMLGVTRIALHEDFEDIKPEHKEAILTLLHRP